MTEWPTIPLGELVDLFDHKRIPLSSKQRSARPGPYPYYGAQGVIDHIDDFIFDGRFILIPEDGENLRSRKLPIAYFAEGQFWVNNHAHIAKAKPGIAVDRFVQSAVEAIDIGAFVTGAAQPKLTQENLRQIPISVPSMEQQRMIASVLDAFDDLIENNRRRVEVLEAMAKAIYREWFVHFRYPGHENATLVDSPLGPIPDGWEIVSLGEMADLGRRSVQPRRSADVEFDHFSIPAFDAGRLPSPELGETIRSGKYLVERPAVMVSKLNPRIERTWFARPSAGRTGIASTEFLILRPAGHTSLEFLYATARSATFQERLRALSGGTSTSHQRTRPGDFLQLEVLDPGAEPVARFSTAIGPALELVHELLVASRRLAALRDLLLPKLVTGQVDVSSLDLGSLVEAAGGLTR